MRSFTAGMVSAVLLGCVGDSPASDGGLTGEEGGPCFSDFTCKTGLVCNKGPNICVQPDSGVTTDGGIPDGSQDSQVQDVVSGGCSTTGLIAWWKAENNNGNDEQGHFNLTGSSTAFGSGQVGNAFILDGANDYFENFSSNSTFVNLPSLTIEGWIRTGSVTGLRVIFSRRADAVGAGPLFGVNNGHLHYQVGNSSVTGTYAFSVTTAFHHVAVTYTGTAVQLYVDGQPDGNPFPLSGTVPGDNVTLRVGARLGQTAGPFDAFAGGIDELAFYSTALSSQDIATIAQGNSFAKCH